MDNIMKGAFAGYDKAMKEESEKNAKLYAEIVKPILEGAELNFVQLFESYTEDSSNWGWRVSDTPEASSNEEVDGNLKVFIDQSGGFTGDNYAGTVSLEMTNGKYLNWDYSM